ncbi:tRNA pseudouridine(38-40) synthase TruA [Tunturiibacter empetritectus]|uniref:tRNA pseudouridine synthase A n=2 Tax=Tunturiibacter TaxID=3154218 RepID=A0A852VEA3_9BACT|nr:tRNA pseudouridine(38-40) synthase TruA [Edaphobacter lichenicola]NYF89561.1 tRNA pseudouridine38-40 synthase [Edaphobacter lichenicola]
MPHWKTILTYDGTPYNGWQIQPSLPTVQGTLAQAIHRVTGETVLPQGSGRTDTGVHALGQVATFSLSVPIPAANLHRALNRALPPSIRILAIEAVSEDFHARHSARRKTYEYRILPSCDDEDRICSPMLAPYVWACRLPLELAALQQAAIHILGTHDFTSFAAADPDLTTRTRSLEEAAVTPTTDSTPSPIPTDNTRTIFHSAWHQQEDLLIYRITGSGFLHHMVRNLVGTFVEAAANRLPPDAIPKILAARNRSAAGPTAPARGLFLVEVLYTDAEITHTEAEANS